MLLKPIMTVALLLTVTGQSSLTAQTADIAGRTASRPLFRDPVHDGAADPVVIWNRAEKKWFMFYTNRRANLTNGVSGVEWVHGTKIGIAESSDGGATWNYRGTADIDFGGEGMTHWAPEVIEHDGMYHMYLTFVPGIFRDWGHPRDIIHLTSKDLLKWEYQSTLKLASDRVIDACVLRLPDGNWRMWYNNERDKKSIYYADSSDLYHWENKGKAPGTSDRGGEGPKVVRWKDKYWMAVDIWAGLRIYRSDDATTWQRQPFDIVREPGTGEDDGVAGQHPDLVINNDRAYLFYFTHPGRRGDDARKDGPEQRRSSIQVVELKLEDGWLTANRDEPTRINLLPPVPATSAGQRYKIAVADLMILKRQKLGAFQLASELGADGVEVDMGGLGNRETFDNQLTNAATRRLFLDTAKQYGLEIPSLAMTGFFAQSFAKRPTVPRMIRDCIDTMKQMDVKIAFLPLGVQGDLQKNPELRPAIVERLRAAGKQAEAAGVVIGVETSLSAAEEVKLLDEVGSPAIKIYFNFSDAAKNGRDIPTELRTLGRDRICQIHASNEDGVWLENDPEIDLPKIKATLDEMGWSGWLVIERSRDANDPRNVKKNFTANTAHLKKVFQTK